MPGKKQLHLTAFMRPVSLHTGAWRYPNSYPDANFNLTHLTTFIEKLERAKFDAFFMADHLAVLNMPPEALKRSHTTTSFEPFTLLSALSQLTTHIGLAATASTTYDEPYHIARRFASLDHLSNGRAAWNIVTTGNPESSKNFGQDAHMPHSDRYTGLFDIAALSSSSEQFPLAVVEAMAAGLPVVSTPVGDVPTMVAESNQPYVTDTHGEVDLRDRLQILIDRPDLRAFIGATNQAKARSEFDEGAMIARYAELYAGVAGRPGALG